MAAFDSTDFTLATGEQIDASSTAGFQERRGFHDVHPNFNGPAGRVFTNLPITNINELPQGMLFTAAYAEAALNTVTVQFTAPTVSVSTTVADWTLSGPSVPSITSVTYLAGSRGVLLNLSGPLSSVNTYTLSIAANKVLSGSQVLQPKDGVYNWPRLTVDVILPSQIDCIGVGIAQVIDMGTPNVNISGDAVGVGFEQPIDLGMPTANTLISTTGVGIDQPIDLGIPFDYTQADPIGVGINQTITLGTPVATRQEMPVGVGINQTIDLGTPVADITPLEPVGVGINQTIILGTPVAACPSDVIGVGIAQAQAFGTPTVDSIANQYADGVGVNQIIGVGQEPWDTIYPLTPDGVGIAQAVTLGTPQCAAPPQFQGVGINQTVPLGTPVVDISPLEPVGVGIDQLVGVGIPFTPPIQSFGIGVNQIVDVGLPDATITPLTPNGVGVNQIVALGTPNPTGATTVPSVGIAQPISLGTPNCQQVHNFSGVGIQQDVSVGNPLMWTALNVTTSQKAALISLDAALHQAFGDGVEGPVFDELIDPIEGYTDDFTTLQQLQVRTIFEDTAAAAMTAFNIPGALPNTNNNDSTTLAKTAPTGSTGSLTWVDGVLVAKVDPLGIESIGVGIEQTVAVGSPTMSHT